MSSLEWTGKCSEPRGSARKSLGRSLAKQFVKPLQTSRRQPTSDETPETSRALSHVGHSSARAASSAQSGSSSASGRNGARISKNRSTKRYTRCAETAYFPVIGTDRPHTCHFRFGRHDLAVFDKVTRAWALCRHVATITSSNSAVTKRNRPSAVALERNRTARWMSRKSLPDAINSGLLRIASTRSTHLSLPRQIACRGFLSCDSISCLTSGALGACARTYWQG